MHQPRRRVAAQPTDAASVARQRRAAASLPCRLAGRPSPVSRAAPRARLPPSSSCRRRPTLTASRLSHCAATLRAAAQKIAQEGSEDPPSRPASRRPTCPPNGCNGCNGCNGSRYTTVTQPKSRYGRGGAWRVAGGRRSPVLCRPRRRRMLGTLSKILISVAGLTYSTCANPATRARSRVGMTLFSLTGHSSGRRQRAMRGAGRERVPMPDGQYPPG
jgi:hypothetical protein